mmetsp:Transcript_20737/g.35385  ORF Transcript_20737/g.35385 Transcript_20737/m.35385 type:complete len:228 (+) Transcript_20737:74-757(+)
MLKLKQLQEKKKKEAEAAKKAAAEANNNDNKNDSDPDKKDESSEQKTDAKDAKVEGVFSIKKGGRKNKSRANAAQLRAQKDVSEMDPIPGCVLNFPDPDNLMDFRVDITPSEGLYKDATFNFTVTVPPDYPFKPPKAMCNTPIYHPNIDTEGHVCLNILRSEWMPVLSLGSVVFGLLTLFLEPNADDPLNKEAAAEMAEKPAQFRRNVEQTLRGGFVMGRQYPQLRK